MNMTAFPAGPASEATAARPADGEWWSDEPEMETYPHLMQMLALISTLRWRWRDRTDYFVGGNLSIYYSSNQRKSEDIRGPDFFVVLGVDGTRERNSWVVWEEGGRFPNVIVELLSASTAEIDRGVKKRIYAEIFRTPEYFLFDVATGELEGFRWVGGHYEPIVAGPHGRLACAQLDLQFGVVAGELRMFTPSGELLAKPEEDADEQRHLADEQRLRAERAEAELAALRAKLGE